MSPLAIAKRLGRALASILGALLAALPPYRRFEGTLVAKEAREDGSYFLLVDGEIVEVDWLTFDTLMIGEALRIRSTRDNKAINIDRLLP
jgi:hypothetical protein